MRRTLRVSMQFANPSSFVVCQVGALPEAELAARVRADRCDVLVELTGHTAGNRLGVLAMRPAPVQVFWGFVCYARLKTFTCS